MYLCFSVLSFWSQLTNAARLICLMPYLYPSESTSIFFPLDSFSILCFLFPLQSWFLPIWVFNFLFHVSPHLQLSLIFSLWTSSFLSDSWPLISQTFSHEIGFSLWWGFLLSVPSSYLSCSVFSPSSLFSLPPHSSAVLNFLTFFITSHLPPNFSIPSYMARTLLHLDLDIYTKSSKSDIPPPSWLQN